jgi:LysR family positive regulator for ilvC
MVALGCGVGVVPELVRKDSPLKSKIELVNVAKPPRGYHVSLCAKQKTLARRTTAALWELAPGASL